jgi:hypothetical protein
MATVNDEKPTLEFASRLSDLEKRSDLQVAVGFEDPDEGLSDEERAKIVCDPCIPNSVLMHGFCVACRHDSLLLISAQIQ